MALYYGEGGCAFSTSKGPCKNKAYWSVKTDRQPSSVGCGVHARDSKTRAPLPKRSAKDKARLAEEALAKNSEEIEAARVKNFKKGRQGHLLVSKLRIMKAPEDFQGYQKVFPNFKHGNRKDGLGMPSLSPMSLGPVEHPQPGLPVGAHIEGVHQGSKVFPCYLKKGEPTKEWFEIQLEMFTGPPRRHHPGAKSATGSKNVPDYSRWINPDGSVTKLSYIESRQVYCTYYERLAKETKAFKKLAKLLEKGTNLQILGYDGYDLELSQEDQEDQDLLEEKFEELYLDGSRPFGHEVALAALLLLEEDRYPWTKHTTLEL